MKVIQMLYLVFASAFPMFAMPEQKGAGVNYMEAGRQAGGRILEAEAGSFKIARKVLMEAAREFGHGLGMQDGKLHVYARDWLDGFKAVMGDTRASECKAIFIASTIGDKELPVGIAKGKKELGQDETKEYVQKETHTGLVWLERARSYGELVKIAKEVKGKDSRGGGNAAPKTELTGAKMETAEKLVKETSVNQAAVLIQGALGVVASNKDSDKILIHQIIGITRYLEKSKDEAVKKASKDIAEIAVTIVGKIMVAETQSGLAASTLAVPLPAVAAQSAPVAEAGEKLAA